VPFTTADTRLTFGFHVLFVRLCEWLTRIPKETPLPQNSHLAICCTSLRVRILCQFQNSFLILTDEDEKCKHEFHKQCRRIFDRNVSRAIKALQIAALLYTIETVSYTCERIF
jgi:hypothetical protein